MIIARHYTVIASDGNSSKLCDALVAHVERLRSAEGFGGGVLLRGTEHPGQFMFVPRWNSLDEYLAGGKALDEEAFARLADLLEGPPEGITLEYVQLTPA